MMNWMVAWPLSPSYKELCRSIYLSSTIDFSSFWCLPPVLPPTSTSNHHVIYIIRIGLVFALFLSFFIFFFLSTSLSLSLSFIIFLLFFLEASSSLCVVASLNFVVFVRFWKQANAKILIRKDAAAGTRVRIVQC